MATAYTKETKVTTTFTKENRPGRFIQFPTWDDANVSWDDVQGTWDTPIITVALTVYTKETKP